MFAENNPFNIRTGSQWLGLCGSIRGFCMFSDLKYGVRAAAILLMRSYRKKGLVTIKDIIYRFAPPSENLTESYISYVCKNTGYLKTQILSTRWQYKQILACMAYYESYTPVRVSYIDKVLTEFNIQVYEKK